MAVRERIGRSGLDLRRAVGFPWRSLVERFQAVGTSTDSGTIGEPIARAVRSSSRISWLSPTHFLTFAILITPASPQPVRASHDLTADDVEAFADSAFADYLQHSPQPSLAFVVVNDQGVLFARGYGTEDAAGTRAVDPATTMFWMASLSKLITADAVMREVDQGRIRLESPAGEYLDRPLPSRNGWTPITIKHLLTHTSGLDEPFMEGSENDPARLVSLNEYLSRIHWRAGTRPGDILRYSNHGMALAGHLVERTSGISFADYVEREIFTPLGMTRSTFRQPIPDGLAQRIATAGTDVANDYLLPAPAGSMVGTATDMGRFLSAQLDSIGPHAASLAAMHSTQWRAHPDVPGAALGWFETDLGGVSALYHTGARHHFSVAWLSPTNRVGLFLVHSMRQGGPFQNLRTDVVRAFAQRYLVPDAHSVPESDSSAHELAVDGIYRPEILSKNTVERAGDLFLDTPVKTTEPGSVTMRAPGGLGAIAAHSIGDGVFEVQSGPQAGLRLGFVSADGHVERIAMGGTLQDPIVFTRLKWWQRGIVHAAFLAVTSLAIGIAAAVQIVRRIIRRRRKTTTNDNPGWMLIAAAGTVLGGAALTFAITLVTTPEIGAAAHMRSGIRTVLVLLSIAAVLCAALPVVTFLAARRRHESPLRHPTLFVLSLAGAILAVLLSHYRLIGFSL
jgi:CubicO group peptidase (beta-lactamase class C family)